MKIDDNVELLDDGSTKCIHCNTTLGQSGSGTLAEALVVVRSSRDAGPSVHADPSEFTDRPIVLRQVICPGCLVLLSTEIAPGDEQSFRSWEVSVGSGQSPS